MCCYELCTVNGPVRSLTWLSTKVVLSAQKYTDIIYLQIKAQFIYSYTGIVCTIMQFIVH